MNKEDFLKDLFSQELIPASRSEPKTLIVYSKGKQGKSTIMAGLTKELNGKAKILSNEPYGYDNLDANVTYCLGYREMMTALKQFKEDSHGFKFLIIDGLSKLQEQCMVRGTMILQQKAIGKNWNVIDGVRVKPNHPKWQDASAFPNGYGWQYNRIALIKEIVDDILLQLPEDINVILVGHIKDSVVEEGLGNKISVKQLASVGKNSNLLTERFDGTARLERKGDEGYLLFDNLKSEGSSGSRYPHLQGKILISKRNEDLSVTTFWSNVYPSIAKLK